MGLVSFAVWAMLAVSSYRVTGNLVEISSQELFDTAARSIKADLLEVYSPVKRTTSILAYNQVDIGCETDRCLALVPMVTDVLTQLHASTAIQFANAQGDYFIVRELQDGQLAERFSAPEQAAFGVDHIDGASHAYQRWFYDAALNLLEKRTLPDSDYDPRTRPWYRAAMGGKNTVFSEPYVFYFMDEVGVTAAAAAPDKQSVAAIDITLRTISASLTESRPSPSSVAALAINGSLIAWNGEQPILIKGDDGQLRQRTLAELGHPVIAAVAEGASREGWLTHRTALLLGANFNPEFMITVPEDEYLTGLRRTRNWALGGSFLLLALLIPISWVFAQRVTRPLHDLHAAIRKVGEGDFDFWLPEIRSFDEVGDLNLALRTMRVSLKEYIQNLADATAARERLESELDIARRIQMGMVPGNGSYEASIGDYGIFARLFPAKAVGGDLYQHFELADGKFFVAIGDVSDKGIPAALFMARMVPLVKLLVYRTESLETLLTELNEELSVDNDECMFTTYFCAIVDPATGIMQYACAGHNPPILVGDDGASYLEFDAGTPLGVFPGMEYPQFERTLQAGERLVMYTDGITEAFDGNRQEFGEQRLLDLLAATGNRPDAPVLGSVVLDAVHEFVADAPQSDDITLLVLQRS